MTFQVVAIVLVICLIVLTFMRWKGTHLFWPMLSFALALLTANFLYCISWMAPPGVYLSEWFAWFGITVVLTTAAHSFQTDVGKAPTALSLFFLIWLVAIAAGQLDLQMSAGIAGLIALFQLRLVERLSNRMAETFRVEIVSLILILVFYILSNCVLFTFTLVNNSDDIQYFLMVRSIIDSIFLVFGILYIQQYTKTKVSQDIVKSTRYKTNIGVFGWYFWLFLVISVYTPVTYRAGVIAVGTVGFIILGMRRNLMGQLKIYATKLFSNYKYNYRESWLRFNRALDEASQESDFEGFAIKALANIVDSGNGRLWAVRRGRASYSAHWQSPNVNSLEMELPDYLIDFIDKHNWVVDVREYRQNPGLYQGLKLDLSEELFQNQQVFVPLRRGEKLAGIVGLEAPNRVDLNWEEHDLLKAAGQQMASYLALFEATGRIYEQEQFAAFNRLSAFVVHDLKNVTTQLELISHNAQKFGENKEFISDSFETVASATDRLKKMLRQFNRQSDYSEQTSATLLPEAFKTFESGKNRINLDGFVPALDVAIDEIQLNNIICHLHQNALEASKKNKAITHSFELKNSDVLWHITDQGKGMDGEFIRTRLFKPFATTKGNAGMGIGVYQCRYLLRSFGGDLIVSSELDKGTRVTAILPLVSVDTE